MSVVHEFDCNRVLVDEPNKTLLMLGIDNGHYKFTYDIKCTADLDLMKIKFYFSFKQAKCLIIHKEAGFFKCAAMKFHISNDSPMLAAQWFNPMNRVMAAIDAEFKEQLASMIIDEAINS